MTARARRSAFTLMELLVAMSVGLMVMAAAATGARLSAGAVTAANRLAQENALLRAGAASALEEIDFWRTYDDPDAPSTDTRARRLRGWIERPDGASAAPVRLGMPFTPLRDAWPADAADPVELDGRKWSAANRASRWRGDLVERVSGDLRSGRYALFSNVHRQPHLGSPATGDYGVVDVPADRTWLASQMRGLNRALGYYGMFEYTPANSQWLWYGEHRASTAGLPGATDGGYDLEFVDEKRDGDPRDPYFCMLQDWNDNNFPSFDGGAAFTVVPPNPVTDAWTADQLVAGHRSWFPLANIFAAASASYAPRTVLTRPLLALSPSHWPQVQVSVSRAYVGLRFNADCRLRWTSPVTGRTTELTFTACGTTLRGARQQRGLDAP